MPLIIPYPSFTPGTTIFSAQANNNNAAIAAWANAHELLSTGVHGVTGTIVGTGSTNNFTGVNTFISGNLRIYSSATPAFYLGLAVSSSYTANRTLTIATGDSSRTITLGGDITTAGPLATSGSSSITLTSTGATNITLPTTGTLATLAGVETLTNKTLTAPNISSPVLSGTATGTYTLGGTPTISSPSISSPTISGTVAGDHTYSGQLLFANTDPPTANYANRNGIIKGWAYINASGSVGDSYNVSSVSKTTTGTYQVSWNTNFASDNFSAIATIGGAVGFISFSNFLLGGAQTYFTTYNSSGTLTDSTLSIMAIGDQ